MSLGGSIGRTVLHLLFLTMIRRTSAFIVSRSSRINTLSFQNINKLCYITIKSRLYATINSNNEDSVATDHEDNNSNFFATDYHAPVMVNECVTALLDCQQKSNRIFVDGTLGGGGHSQAILEQLQPGDILIGCDVDSNALDTATKRLQKYTREYNNDNNLPLFVPLQTNFGRLDNALTRISNDILKNDNKPILVDGLLLDLGVSSHQIDTADRGFAFLQDGPLDMRMQNTTSLTAAHLCNEFDHAELTRIFKTYGDEPRARAIAQAIVEHRPLLTTGDLYKAVATVVPEFSKKSKRSGRKSTLARVFQSLRIVVNQEDTVLEQVLMVVAPKILRPGGRLVVLSYHSMEDRATKRVMRDGVLDTSMRTNERDVYGNLMGPPRPFVTIGKRQKASDEEVERNRRARSATLRVAERQ